MSASSDLDATSDEDENHFRRGNGSLVLQLSVLCDASFDQPQRPFGEFFCRPSMPTRETCTTTLLVNLLWFARNYYNLVLLASMGVMLFAPPFALAVLSVSITYILRSRNGKSGAPCTSPQNDMLQKKKKGNHPTVMLFGLIRFLVFIGTCYVCGFLFITVCFVGVVALCLFHAMFTPYTDKAFELYSDVLCCRRLPLRLPCSPTRQFTCVDPSFDALSRQGSTVMSPRGGSCSKSSSPWMGTRTPEVLHHSFSSSSRPSQGEGIHNGWPLSESRRTVLSTQRGEQLTGRRQSHLSEWGSRQQVRGRHRSPAALDVSDFQSDVEPHDSLVCAHAGTVRLTRVKESISISPMEQHLERKLSRMCSGFSGEAVTQGSVLDLCNDVCSALETAALEDEEGGFEQTTASQPIAPPTEAAPCLM
ncbi:hypothetical protein, conserved [Trypanosoma brucei gambiense DAL972]|uniref:PRA1 family protein n=2 Tax=Trypanosoma brucei TaxID=5691 RepID=D0A434_TRYB9|nr:hypothetical protein, conserved [Trypanosoma brucei gambiense DAL972]RHW69395.1 PRA1 family protein [Trypanosoma brucei equiperdum]CBH16028.1 hypothetical protein, conserved [Trypanosoma brucei gambiense DAL972]|eukprot:XP_011778292.1 hypothetical protein, conserved [Trypanosoma brucei gambiense DAL972]